MAQKVVTVVIKGYRESPTFVEHEFPVLKEYLEKGHEIKEVLQSVATSANGVSNVVLTFILFAK